MRIAISGTHGVGKTSLLEALSAVLPKYASVDEPYNVLVEDGYEFADPPVLEDFEAQLEHAIDSLSETDTAKSTLFDRCPVDFIAYIESIEDSDAFDLDDWLARMGDAMQTLDLVVFVPIEAPDRIARSSADHDPSLRRKVDARLREILLDDALGLDMDVIEVEGSVAQRVQAVLTRVRKP